jgi:hypothetical protein
VNTHLAVAIIGLAAASTPVVGQSFNIDLGAYADTVTASDYGAAAGQTGHWNYYSQNDARLRDLSGSPTSVEFGITGAGLGLPTDIAGLGGNEERFMESFANVQPSASTFTLFGIAPGIYDCYIYSWMGPVFGSATVTFQVQAKNNKATGQVSYNSPAWPGGQIKGVTYDVLRIEVPANAFFMDISVGMDTDFQILNGLQIVRVPAPASAMLLAPLAWAARRRRG